MLSEWILLGPKGMTQVRTVYRLPFCSSVFSTLSDSKNVDRPETVWRAVSPGCKTATVTLGAVFACVAIASVVVNILTMLAAFSGVRVKRYTKSDPPSEKRLLRYKNSVWVSLMPI